MCVCMSIMENNYFEGYFSLMRVFFRMTAIACASLTMMVSRFKSMFNFALFKCFRLYLCARWRMFNLDVSSLQLVCIMTIGSTKERKQPIVPATHSATCLLVVKVRLWWHFQLISRIFVNLKSNRHKASVGARFFSDTKSVKSKFAKN